MLLTAISSIPIRNTTVESTASGMYWSGLVRNSSTTSTTPAQVSDASWLRPPAPSTICVLVGLPLTTKVPDTPAAALAKPRPTRSTSSLKRSPYLAANAREVAALWARITMKIENAVAASAGASEPQLTSGRPRLGSPPGTCPSTATPWLWKSNTLLSTIEPTTAISAPGTTFSTYVVPRITTATPIDTPSVQPLVSPTFWSVPHSLCSVPPSVPDATPSMPPTWPAATWIPTPVRKPTSTVRDRKSARNPRCTSRATIR